jgi:hypothetical protein
MHHDGGLTASWTEGCATAAVKGRVVEIARAARSKSKPGQAKLRRAYGQLLRSTSRGGGSGQRLRPRHGCCTKRVGSVTGRGEAGRPARRDSSAWRRPLRHWPLALRYGAASLLGSSRQAGVLSAATGHFRRAPVSFLGGGLPTPILTGKAIWGQAHGLARRSRWEAW